MLTKDDPNIIRGYLEDNSGLKGGYVKKVLLPENTEDITRALREANERHMPVTVSGNGTGVTGGRVPFGGILLSTERLNKIIKIERIGNKNGTARVQAGVMLKDLKDAVSKEGLLYPPDPTEDTAYIGGNIATNASGARGFKYGSTRKYVKGIKTVLANGEVLDLKRGNTFAEGRSLNLANLGCTIKSLNLPTYDMPLIKNSAGYYIHKDIDTVDIFIGQEGTLGVITEVELALREKEEGVLTFFAFFKFDKDAKDFVYKLKNEVVLSIEYFDSNSLRLLRRKYADIPEADAALFFEKAALEKDEERVLERILQLLKENRAYHDKTLLAQTPNEYKKFHEIRRGLPEMVNEIVKKNGLPKVGTDLAVPEEGFDAIFSLYKSALMQSDIPHVIFGHIAECHLHVNMLPSSEIEYNRAKELYMQFVKEALKLGGTVSAEHSIGKLKHKYLEMMYGRKGIMEMVSLKKGLDPHGILGVGNIFPRELLEQ